MNALSSHILRVGQNLIIPPGEGYVYSAQSGDTIEGIAKKYSLSVEVITKSNAHIAP